MESKSIHPALSDLIATLLEVDLIVLVGFAQCCCTGRLLQTAQCNRHSEPHPELGRWLSPRFWVSPQGALVLLPPTRGCPSHHPGWVMLDSLSQWGTVTIGASGLTSASVSPPGRCGEGGSALGASHLGAPPAPLGLETPPEASSSKRLPPDYNLGGIGPGASLKTGLFLYKF